jgi:hypothetical protein
MPLPREATPRLMEQSPCNTQGIAHPEGTFVHGSRPDAPAQTIYPDNPAEVPAVAAVKG